MPFAPARAWSRLLSASEIATATAALGARIAADYPSGELTLLGLLRGGLFFLADLARAIPAPLRIETLQPQSYFGALVSSGQVTLAPGSPRDLDLAGRDVILVDDIFDSGRTLRRVSDFCAAARARSVAAACLVVKDAPRAAEVEVRYRVADIPDRFVVGCGLDWDGLGRNLPDLWALDPSAPQDAARKQLLALLAHPA